MVGWLDGKCRAAEERMLMGSRRRTWHRGAEGKARTDQPDRLAASTRVMAEPCVLYRAGAKAFLFSLLLPLFHSVKGWLLLSLLFHVSVVQFSPCQATQSLAPPCLCVHLLSISVSVPDGPISPSLSVSYFICSR